MTLLLLVLKTRVAWLTSLEGSNTCYFLRALFEFSEFRVVDSRWIFPLRRNFYVRTRVTEMYERLRVNANLA